MAADAARPLLPPATLLLCCHGTAGARAAVRLALEIASAGATTIVQGYVVPALWAGMQGDDWLNNASTRDDFARHLERQLIEEAESAFAEVERGCQAAGLAWRGVLKHGEPTAELLALAAEVRPDLVVIGPPRPKGEPGLRSRLDLERFVRGLACPLLIAPRG